MKKSKNALSVAVTLIVIALYLLPNFAAAISLGLQTDKTIYSPTDDIVIFDGTIDVEQQEQIPLKNITIQVSNGKICTFTVNGNFITSCPNMIITIANITPASFGYGYNSGYGYSPISSGIGSSGSGGATSTSASASSSASAQSNGGSASAVGISCAEAIASEGSTSTHTCADTDVSATGNSAAAADADGHATATTNFLGGNFGQTVGYGYSTFGYGYGYGGVAGFNGELRYKVEWNVTADEVPAGDYAARLYATASNGGTNAVYTSNLITFTIQRATTNENTASSSSSSSASSSASGGGGSSYASGTASSSASSSSGGTTEDSNDEPASSLNFASDSGEAEVEADSPSTEKSPTGMTVKTAPKPNLLVAALMSLVIVSGLYGAYYFTFRKP